MKSGKFSTEFWVSLLLTVVGAALPVLESALGNDNLVVKVIGAIMAIAGALGYTYNRTKLKSNFLAADKEVLLAQIEKKVSLQPQPPKQP